MKILGATCREEGISRGVRWAALGFVVFLAACGLHAQDELQPYTPARVDPDVVINMPSLIGITYRTNPDIAAARHDLQAAEFAFLESERNLSQFTPLSLKSETWRTQTYEQGAGTSVCGHETVLGPNKEFFNGGSSSTGVGHTRRYAEEEGGNAFARVSLRCPLFGSQVTLKRITQRSFEETRLLDTQLRYVETVRDAEDRAGRGMQREGMDVE